MSETAPPDKSLFFYGPLYHRLLDPPLAEARRVAVDLVPPHSSVLDIGCGTGALCSELCDRKQCRVVGVDLSLRMLEFARASFPGVRFLHLDATDLSAIEDASFDVATVLLLVHELPLEARLRVLHEALRVAGSVLIIDATPSLPNNAAGIGIRAVESTFGHSHYAQFKDFLARGGLRGLLAASEEPVKVLRDETFYHRSREAVLVGNGP